MDIHFPLDSDTNSHVDFQELVLLHHCCFISWVQQANNILGNIKYIIVYIILSPKQTYSPSVVFFNDFNGLVQERRNSIAYAMELHLSCTNPLIWSWSVLPMPFTDASWAQWQICDCPSGSNATTIHMIQYIIGIHFEKMMK